MNTAPNQWQSSDSRALYQIDSWGHGFFDISEKGDVTVRVRESDGSAEVNTSIIDIIQRIRDDTPDFELPTLFRFPSILRERIEELHDTFNQEIALQNYKGRFRGVYPLKVNQQQQVLREQPLDG